MEEKLRDLRRLHGALATLVDDCAAEGDPTSKCPILNAMREDQKSDAETVTPP